MGLGKCGERRIDNAFGEASGESISWHGKDLVGVYISGMCIKDEGNNYVLHVGCYVGNEWLHLDDEKRARVVK
jgi:hypothetical protein